MRSPFAIFRKHQKLMTVVLTGLAMFAFVIFGMISDPTNMPPGLVVLAIAAGCGGVAWLLGVQSGKSSEFGLFGVIVGVALGVALSMAGGPPDVVLADSGNIDARQLNELQVRRRLANDFLRDAYYRAAQRDSALARQPQLFTFYQTDPEQDVVVGELLRREADRLGLTVTVETVNDFIRSVFGGQITAPDVKEIRDRLGISEADLYDVLQDEILARIAQQYLYGLTTLPPETYWEFYRQMKVKEDVALVPLAARDFIDESVEPPEAELQQLFAQYQKSIPNRAPDGTVDEGRPGFAQPRRVRLEYVEVAYTEVEKQVGPVTEEEVQAYYDAHFKAPHTEDAAPSFEDGPLLPELQPEEGSDASPKESPPSESSEPTPRTPPSEPEPTPSDPQSDSATVDPDPEETPSDAKPPVTDETPAQEDPASGEDSTESADESLSALDSGDRHHLRLQRVAVLDETAEPAQTPRSDQSTPEPSGPGPSPTDTEPIAEPQNPPATTTPDPAGDSPEETPSDEEAPATTSTADTAPQADRPPPPPVAAPIGTTPPGEDAAPPPRPGPRPLDDDLRSEIRDDVLRERTEERMTQLIDEVYTFMSQDLQLRLFALEDDPTQITPQQASEELKAFAAQRGLHYVQTPLLSDRELARSEDYSIGKAVDRKFLATTNVVNQVFTAGPDELRRPQKAVDAETDSQFVYWKTEDVAADTPEDMSDPAIRRQVVDTWRALKAREKAEARAAEISAQVRETDQELSEVLAGETVTGTAEGPQLTVLHPPAFSWLTTADPRLSRNPFNTPPPQLTELRSVPGLIGKDFMETAFNELRAGDTGVAHSFDKDYYYVLKIKQRYLGETDDPEAFRKKFLTEPLFASYQFSNYGKLAVGKINSFHANWSRQLFEKHNVQWRERRPESEETQPL